MHGPCYLGLDSCRDRMLNIMFTGLGIENVYVNGKLPIQTEWRSRNPRSALSSSDGSTFALILLLTLCKR